MREYVWYSPEIDVIVFQSIIKNYYINFEWKHSDMCDWLDWDASVEIDSYLWIPLGEL